MDENLLNLKTAVFTIRNSVFIVFTKKWLIMNVEYGRQFLEFTSEIQSDYEKIIKKPKNELIWKINFVDKDMY